MTTTRYEIRAYFGDKSVYVAMTARRTLERLRENTYCGAADIVAALGCDPEATVVSRSVEGGIVFSDGAVVRFSGFTELDRINEARLAAKADGVDPDAEAIAQMAHF